MLRPLLAECQAYYAPQSIEESDASFGYAEQTARSGVSLKILWGEHGLAHHTNRYFETSEETDKLKN